MSQNSKNNPNPPQNSKDKNFIDIVKENSQNVRFVDLIEKKEEDADQDYIKLDSEHNFEIKEKRQKIFASFQESLTSVIDKLKGVRPEGHQERNLDREKGGIEDAKAADEKVTDKQNTGKTVDAWDNRGKEVEAMIKAAQQLNSAATSTRERSVIHRKHLNKKSEAKEEKRHGKGHKHSRHNGHGLANTGFVAKIKGFRKTDDTTLGPAPGGMGPQNGGNGGMGRY